MSIPKKDQTQEHIRATAIHLFFVDGKFDATTQEIADAAGVNRTLINYYFRSRDNLLKEVFEQAIREEKKKSISVEDLNLPFREIVSRFIDDNLHLSVKYPYLETYIVSQINRGNCLPHQEVEELHIEKFYAMIRTEIENGNIDAQDPRQFLLNLASLLMFPSTMRPLLIEKLQIPEEDFNALLAERKEIIMNLLFKKNLQ